MPSIVWIEDDAAIIGGVVEPLLDEGYEVSILANIGQAKAGIDLLKGADAIILDVFLPMGGHAPYADRRTGIHLLRELRDTHGVSAPVVLLSVVDPLDQREELRRLGVISFLRKPVLPSRLKAAIDTVIDSRLD